MVDKEEISQSPVAETHLGDRSRFYDNGSSRFGLCLVNTEETDRLFKDAVIYQPSYFPPGMSIDILPHADNSNLPWTFRLPYRGGKKAVDEPTDHTSGLRRLTKAEFDVGVVDTECDYLSNFDISENVVFRQVVPLKLHLEFDHGRQNKMYRNDDLDLIIRY